MTISKSWVVSCLSVLSLSLFTHHTQAASSAFDPHGQWLLGDWNGQRTALQDQGYNFSADYTGEFAGVLDSKQHSSHGSEFTGQLAFTL
jgi:porin